MGGWVGKPYRSRDCCADIRSDAGSPASDPDVVPALVLLAVWSRAHRFPSLTHSVPVQYHQGVAWVLESPPGTHSPK